MYRIRRLIILILTYFITSNPALATNITQALDAQLEQNAQRYGVVSQSVLILKNGKIIYNGLQGKANIELAVSARNDSLYPVYSLSKLFASVLMMQLVEKGDVDPNKSIRYYLPNLPIQWDHVTVNHCLNHMSGLPEYFTLDMLNIGFAENKEAIFKSLADQPFQFETGDRNNYNNTNYLIISSIIEKITKKSYYDLALENIITPLKLANTDYASAKSVVLGMVTSYREANGNWQVDRGVDWPEYTYVHSGLYSTKHDLVNFMTALLQGKFVSLETLEQLWQPMRLNNSNQGRYAFGWEYSSNNGISKVGHDGGNRVKLRHYFKASSNGAQSLKQDDFTVVYLTNGSNRGVWTDVLTGSLMSIIDPKLFPLETAGELVFDTVFGKADINKLDELFLTLSKNEDVRSSGLEGFINMKAYALMFGAGPDYAIKLFELNTRKFPNSANAWDSLAEVWLVKGDKTKAMTFYKKALELDPTSTSIIQRIEALTE